MTPREDAIMNMVKKLLCLSIILGLCYSPVHAAKPEKKSEQSSSTTSKFVKTIIVLAVIGTGIWYLRKRWDGFKAQQIPPQMLQPTPVQPEPQPQVQLPVLTNPEAIEIKQILTQATDIVVQRAEHNSNVSITDQERIILLQSATYIIKRINELPYEIPEPPVISLFIKQIKRLFPCGINKRESWTGFTWQAASSQLSASQNPK